MKWEIERSANVSGLYQVLADGHPFVDGISGTAAFEIVMQRVMPGDTFVSSGRSRDISDALWVYAGNYLDTSTAILRQFPDLRIKFQGLKEAVVRSGLFGDGNR